MSEGSERRFVPWTASVLVGLAAVLAYLPPVRSVGLRTDVGGHLLIAQRMDLTGEAFGSFYLFEQLTIIVRALVPFGFLSAVAPEALTRWQIWQISGVLVVLGAVAATSQLLLVRFAHATPVALSRRRRVELASAATLGLLVAAPLTFLTWGRRHLLTGYVATTHYESPTTTLLHPFALALFWYLADRWDRPRTTRREVAIAALLTVLALHAKATFVLVFGPVVAVGLVAATLRGRRVGRALLVVGFLLPAAVVLVAQALVFLSEGGIGFGPLESVRAMLEGVGLPLWMAVPMLAGSLALPIAVAVVHRRALRRSISLLAAWGMVVVGAAVFYLLSITGRTDYGDLVGGLQVAAFVLFAESVRLGLAEHEPGTLRRGEVVLVGVALAHVACGAFLWYHEVVHPAAWW
ncbi:MAG: hypothetical protein R2702_11575 [Acidimicrobiales bacterium]